MRQNQSEPQHAAKITELAELMNEFQLTKARYQVGDFSVCLRRTPKQPTVRSVVEPLPAGTSDHEPEAAEAAPAAAPIPQGTPVASPMTGIYYASPNPSSPAFVKLGDEVVAGQTIGLIEAMKVFNEIPSPVSGKVLSLTAASGDLVQNGDVLLHIG